MRYERVGDASDASDNVSSSSMSADQKLLSFPLESDLQEMELPSLPAGRYVVCAEAVRGGKLIEEACFVTVVRKAKGGAKDSGEGGGESNQKAAVSNLWYSNHQFNGTVWFLYRTMSK